MSDEVKQLKKERSELLSELKQMTRMVEAFSYVCILSKNQRQRFEQAKALIVKVEASK